MVRDIIAPVMFEIKRIKKIMGRIYNAQFPIEVYNTFYNHSTDDWRIRK